MQLKQLSQAFDAFVIEASKLREAHKSRIELLVGLETDFITQLDLDGLDNLLKRHKDNIDYIVGSIHHVNEVPIDLDEATFRVALRTFVNPGENDVHDDELWTRLAGSYFDAQFVLMQCYHPEIIGHFDLCRLYRPQFAFEDRPFVWEKIQRNIRFAVSYGALFEANASAFRKGWETAYPGKDVAELILKENGRFVLSDDSHGPAAVGLNYHRLFQYLRDLGVHELWHLRQSPNENAGGRRTAPIKLDGQWWDHTFWTRHF